MTRQDIMRNVKHMRTSDLQRLYDDGLKTRDEMDKTDSEVMDIVEFELIDRMIDEADYMNIEYEAEIMYAAQNVVIKPM